MDLGYWGFRYWPFERSLATDRFFASSSHEEALSRLLFLIEQSRRCGVIAGPHGAGKTLLLKLAAQRAERLGRTVIRCEGLDPADLVTQVTHVCVGPCAANLTSAAAWNAIRTRFTAMALIRQPVVILVDHFEAAEAAGILTLRRIQQLADSVGLKLTTVISTALAVIPPGLQELADLRIEVTPLSVDDTSTWIRSAVEGAGCRRSLFTEEAVTTIHRVAGGIPSTILSLCDLCLLAAGGQDEFQVTGETVTAVVPELFGMTKDAAVFSRRSLPSAVSLSR